MATRTWAVRGVRGLEQFGFELDWAEVEQTVLPPMEENREPARSDGDQPREPVVVTDEPSEMKKA